MVAVRLSMGFFPEVTPVQKVFGIHRDEVEFRIGCRLFGHWISSHRAIAFFHSYGTSGVSLV